MNEHHKDEQSNLPKKSSNLHKQANQISSILPPPVNS